MLVSTCVYILHAVCLLLEIFQWLNSIGGILYRCLDYGLGDGEERELSSEVTNLIEELTTPPDNREDEGVDGLEDALPVTVVNRVREVRFIHLLLNV